MPTISLRLTEAEHDELRAWAHDGHRSLQKEIIWRLFSAEAHVGANPLPKIGPAGDEPRIGIEVAQGETAEIHASGAADVAASSADSRAQGLDSRVTAPDLHFKPDFKKPKK